MLKDYLISSLSTYSEFFESPEYKLFSWGDNSSGQLGSGTQTDRSSPVQVGSLSNWTHIDAGDYHTVGIDYTYGNLWSWGSNTYGELGLGNNTSRSSPVQISFYDGGFNFIDTFIDCSAGNNHTLMIDNNLGTSGYLYSVGYNANGELGLGDNSNRSTPEAVGSDNTWVKVSAGSNHSIAKKSDGSIWGWGFNGSGEVGDRSLVTRSSPVQIGTLTTWAEISAGCYFTLATKTDGTLWAWGDNPNGNLGLGDTNDRSSPVQVGTLSNWSKISACIGPQGYPHSLAVKTDGTLWTWGRNDFGQLGDGTTTNRSSPVQIGSGTNWADVAGGHVFSVALKTDGTIWAWGRNDDGQLGDGTTTTRSSPVQIGSINITYRRIAAGWHHSIGLRL